MSRLLLVRHGVTEFNTSGRFAGYRDTELNAAGYRQVEQLRDRLANEKIDAAYASDLKRALVTAEVVASRHKVDITTCSELREMNYGDAEGMTFGEINRLYPELAEAIARYDLQMAFPDGETFGAFLERARGFLDRLEGYGTSETVLIVSHSGPLRALVCHLLGIDQSHWRQFRIDNASLSIVDTYPRGAIISLLNGTDHLGEGV